MAICYIACDAALVHHINEFPAFKGQKIIEIQFPITATDLEIDLLIVGPTIGKLVKLAATISDWNIPPVALFILPESGYELEREKLLHHPRVGRSIFICKNTEAHILAGMADINAFYQKRDSLQLDNSVSGDYNTNNISPRWL
jgi:hypothetical protein